MVWWYFDVATIMGFKKKIDISPMNKVVVSGPTSDLRADLLEALIIISSEVRERLRYIHKDEIRIIKGRILYIISGKFNNDNLKSTIIGISLISYFLIDSVISSKMEIKHIIDKTIKKEARKRLIKYISSFKLRPRYHFFLD